MRGSDDTDVWFLGSGMYWRCHNTGISIIGPDKSEAPDTVRTPIAEPTCGEHIAIFRRSVDGNAHYQIDDLSGFGYDLQPSTAHGNTFDTQNLGGGYGPELFYSCLNFRGETIPFLGWKSVYRDRWSVTCSDGVWGLK